MKDGSTETASQVTALPTLTESAKLALIAHTISAYALALPKSHAQRLAGRLAADTTRWLSHIFRFVDCASSFHEDHLEGLVRVTRLALHRKYPRYMEEGFTACGLSTFNLQLCGRTFRRGSTSVQTGIQICNLEEKKKNVNLS